MNNSIDAPAIRFTEINGWEAYIVTMLDGKVISTFGVGYFDTNVEAADAADAALKEMKA